MVVSYFTYTLLIVNRENLLPDFTTLANELWIIILIFLFHVTNNIRLSTATTEKRKEKYILTMVSNFKGKFGGIIDERIRNEKLKGLIYAILIIENFNRPKLARWVEYVRFYLTKKPHTLGIMQYRSDIYISDEESIKLGISKIKDAYKNELEEYEQGKKEHYYDEWHLKSKLASVYNGGSEYNSDVIEMWGIIMEKMYPNTTDFLLSEE